MIELANVGKGDKTLLPKPKLVLENYKNGKEFDIIKNDIIKKGDCVCLKDNTNFDLSKRFLSGVVSGIGDGYFMLISSLDLKQYEISFASVGKRYTIVSVNGRIVEGYIDRYAKELQEEIDREILFGDKTLLPKPKLVLANYKNGKDYVTVVWQDDTHTVICRNSEDEYDIDKAIMYATLKKMCGNNGNKMNRYLSSFKKCHKAHEKWFENYSKELAESDNV